MKNSFKTLLIFSLFTITGLFFFAGNIEAHPQNIFPNFNGVTISPRDFVQGSVNSITLSGTFEGAADSAHCDNYSDRQAHVKGVAPLLEVSYNIAGTGIEKVLSEGPDWKPISYGQGSSCGGGTPLILDLYRFYDVQIPVSGLAPGTYQVRFSAFGEGEYSSVGTANQSPGQATFTIAPPTPLSSVRVQSNFETNWSIAGPNGTLAGGGTSANYLDQPSGTYTIYADNLACYSKNVTPSESQYVSPASGIIFDIDYDYNCGGGGGDGGGGGGGGEDTPPPPPPPPPPNVYPSCAGASSESSVTTETSGAFYLRAYGVQNATSVYFPTWSDGNGQDDIVWYPATYIGNNTWEAAVNLGAHRYGSPDYGSFSSHVYMNNNTYSNAFCGTANFARNQADRVPIGVLDAANCSIIGGWAFDLDTSSGEIAVHIYKDGPAGSGSFLTYTSTTGYRPDVNRVYGISGNHGYTVSTPQSLFDGRPHSIYVYGINSNPAGWHSLLINSPMSVTCQAPTPSSWIKANGASGSVSIPYNGSANISWGSENVSGCSVSPGGWNGTSGSQSTRNLTSSVTYTLSCAGTWGSPPPAEVTVNVGPSPKTLTVNSSGASAVSISSNTGHGGTTDYRLTNITHGSTASLTAPSTKGNANFSSWSGCDSVSGATCFLTLNADRTVTANYNTPNYTLSVSKSGSGSGAVTSSPGGISCGGDCSETYQNGTSVTLTVSPSAGSTFTGWSGACSGSGSCTVSMTAARSVTASFTLGTNILSITKSGTGSGTVTSNPAGINCGSTCSASYSYGTSVTLTVSPSAGSTFTGWSGACSGTGFCELVMTTNRSVSAGFSQIPFNYSLSNSGTSSVTKSSGNVYTQNTIAKTYVAGATRSVTLSLAGLPNGVTYSISNSDCSPTCTSTITFTVSPSAPASTYNITVTGQPLGKTTGFNLVINGSPISASCSATPSTAVMGQSVTWTGAVSGGIPPLTYFWSGTNIPANPAPSTNPYSRAYSTIGVKSAALTVTDSDGLQTTCPTATVQVNFDPDFEEF